MTYVEKQAVSVGLPTTVNAAQLPPEKLLRLLHAGRDPGAPYTVYGHTADQMRAYRAEGVAAERERLAKWYATSGWLLDEDDVPDAMRKA